MRKANDDMEFFSNPPSHANSNDPYIWVTDFTDAALPAFYSKFAELEADPKIDCIVVIISSYGGDVSILTAMRDIIKSSPKPVATIALGKAMSAGASLLAAGTKGLRFASPDTVIMIHEVSGYSGGKTADVQESASMLLSLNKKLLANLADDCGIPYATLAAQLHTRKNTDWTMSAQAAKKLGMVDHITIPRQIHISGPVTLQRVDPYERLVRKFTETQQKTKTKPAPQRRPKTKKT